MFDKKKLEVGSTFYSVHETNNAFSRKKEYKEINGVEWFRYSHPPKTYTIVEYRVLGILTKHLSGEWDKTNSWELNTEYYIDRVTFETENPYTTDDFSYAEREYFFSLSDAEKYKKELEELDKKLDRK